MIESEFLSGALILSILGAAVVMLKDIPVKLWNMIWNRIKRKLLYTVTIESTDLLYTYVESWLFKNYKTEYRNVLAELEEFHLSTNNYKRPNEACEVEAINTDEDQPKKQKIHYRQESDIIFIKYHGKRLIITKGREKLEQAKDLFALYFDRFVIKSWLSKKAITKMLEEITEYNEELRKVEKKTIKIRSNDGHYWSYDRELEPKIIEQIFIDEEMKRGLLKDIENFKDNKKWFTDRGIPYKRGYMLSGLPGNGKTTMSLAIGKYCKMDVYALNLLKADNLSNLMSSIRKNSLLLIEDIDAVFDGRKSSNKNISFSNFLQYLDGALYTEGLITIITTNHPEKLDPALVRPGRIDMKLDINNPTHNTVMKYLDMFYEEKRYMNLNGDGDTELGISMADVQNICLMNEKYADAFNIIFNTINKKAKVVATKI